MVTSNHKTSFHALARHYNAASNRRVLVRSGIFVSLYNKQKQNNNSNKKNPQQHNNRKLEMEQANKKRKLESEQNSLGALEIAKLKDDNVDLLLHWVTKSEEKARKAGLKVYDSLDEVDEGVDLVYWGGRKSLRIFATTLEDFDYALLAHYPVADRIKCGAFYRDVMSGSGVWTSNIGCCSIGIEDYDSSDDESDSDSDSDSDDGMTKAEKWDEKMLDIEFGIISASEDIVQYMNDCVMLVRRYVEWNLTSVKQLLENTSAIEFEWNEQDQDNEPCTHESKKDDDDDEDEETPLGVYIKEITRKVLCDDENEDGATFNQSLNGRFGRSCSYSYPYVWRVVVTTKNHGKYCKVFDRNEHGDFGTLKGILPVAALYESLQGIDTKELIEAINIEGIFRYKEGGYDSLMFIEGEYGYESLDDIKGAIMEGRVGTTSKHKERFISEASDRLVPFSINLLSGMKYDELFKKAEFTEKLLVSTSRAYLGWIMAKLLGQQKTYKPIGYREVKTSRSVVFKRKNAK